MFSENIETLFRILSCTNSEIAHAVGCSRSYISHIRNDNRKLTPSSKPIQRLTEGIYQFAAGENMLDTLRMLTRSKSNSFKELTSALTSWLFSDAKTRNNFVEKLPQRSKKTSRAKDQSEFGNRLNEVMKLLELSNTRLARTINVDNSLISRWRRGLRSPQKNKQLTGLLVEALLKRSRNSEYESALAELTKMPVELLNGKQGAEYFEAWLFGKKGEKFAPVMDRLLDSINRLSEISSSPIEDISQLSYEPPRLKRYWNIEGLRQAVIRFLMNAARNGGEIWLYSDESMTWLSGDPSFFAGWKALMTACVQAGVTIKAIHNLDRSMDEMLSAINGWLPLYMSGQVEPFICQKPHTPRFSHTFFLNPGVECIYGISTGETPEKWYDYITDSKRLSALRSEFASLLSCSEPLANVYTADDSASLMRQLPSGIKAKATPVDMSKTPFRDIRIMLTDTEVMVIHTKTPYVAFSFVEPYMVQTIHEYFD